MAGSKTRYHVHGHTVMGELEDIKELRRLATGQLSQIFMHAKEQGQAQVILHEERFTLQRLSDHTFTLEPGAAGQIFM